MLEVLFEGKRAVGVRVKPEDGPEREVRAKVVIDASGQSTLIIDRFGLREWDPELKKAALWTYWKGAQPRHRPRRGGDARHPDRRARRAGSGTSRSTTTSSSVGVVADYDYLFKNRGTKDPEAIYFEEVAKAPGPAAAASRTRRACDIFRIQKEYTYRAKQGGRRRLGAGRRRLRLPRPAVLVRRAARDDLRLDGGGRHRRGAGEGRHVGGAAAASGSRRSCKGMDRIRRLVCEFYDGFSFGRFVKQAPAPEGTASPTC